MAPRQAAQVAEVASQQRNGCVDKSWFSVIYISFEDIVIEF